MRDTFRWPGIVCLCLLATAVPAQEKPLPQSWNYAAAMKKVVATAKDARPGVVLHIGDSITHANPYGQWARHGQAKTDADKAILTWMHTGADNDTDGWYLARFDHPSGGRSHTAAGGIRADEMLAGGKSGLPSLAKLLDTYRPQMVVLMLGTNDASASRTVAAYKADMEKLVTQMTDRGIIPILSTIPPHVGKPDLSRQYNEALRNLAKERELPLIDYEKEILKRRPEDWNGTLLGKNDVHPTASQGGATAASAPTAENLSNSGYLLRGWLSVQKIAEVKRAVLDGLPQPKPEPKPGLHQVPAPTGERVKAAVTRDTWFSNFGAEADGNNGGAGQLKLKSNQEMSLVDLDPAPFKGRVINGATLHLRLSAREQLHRVTVSSFASEWVEGTSRGYAPQKGSSSHRRQRHPDVPWAGPGSDLCSVMLGQGGTIWRMADAFPPDDLGWQRVAVDPSVVAARVAGISHGFLLFDDTGSEWTRQGEQFNFRLFPNRFVHSREAGPANAPYFTIFLGPEDKKPPAAPGDLGGSNGDLPPGEAWLTWTTPQDEGPAGTVGFFVRVNDREVPRYLIPAAGKVGERVRMRLRDLPLKPGSEVKVAVRAVDGAGNVGPAAEATVRVSGLTVPTLPGKAPPPFAEPGELPRLGSSQVAVIDELDKVQPVTGEMIPKQPDGYLTANHLWSANARQVRLHAARNEFIAFQILVRGNVKGIQPKLTFEGEDADKLRVSFGQYRHVAARKGPLPDPIVPLTGGFDVPTADEKIAGQKSGSLHCEIYIPHETKAGSRNGKLLLQVGEETLTLNVSLDVWDFTLPDYLSFLPEMNCYGLPANERDYYRLGHQHRTVLNRVPYHHNGSVDDGCTPGGTVGRFDWTAWDKRFGPYFDGSAFADLPRRGVPLECFYLPLFENWPRAIADTYNGDYWADRAFPPSYRRDFVQAAQEFAAHLGQRQWHDTLFQFYLNGKNDFKQRGWSRSTSPWLLDEPSNFQDYWALRWFGAAFHEGVRQAGGKARLVFRADISRPQWQRDALDGLLDYNVVGSAVRPYHRLVMDRAAAHGVLNVEYGGSNAIDDPNVQPVGWAIDSWSLGTDGVLPWQTVGNAESWHKADELALFYPGREGKGVIPSVRLKAYRRGQQDIEYLTLLMLWKREPRWAIGQSVREALKLSGERKGSGFPGGEDAGLIAYSQLKPQDIWALRVRVGVALSHAELPARRRLIELRTPPRDPSQLAPRYVSVGEVPARETQAGPVELGPAKVLQGRDAVRDTLLDPDRPDRAFGAEGRDLAIRKAEQSGAFLVRFDLDKLALPQNARIGKAVVNFYVWDPSSQGNTKVCAFPLKTAWDEKTATWRRPADGKTWQGGKHFGLAADAGPASPHVVVKPDMGSDTVDPPLEYQLDVTELVKAWLAGSPNHGLAIVPVPDRGIDEGNFTRFQIYSSKHNRMQFTPKLTVLLQR
jgi:lysophospholipase L1-like esterase